jgi:replication initiation and membrane attachment protein DnaB
LWFRRDGFDVGLYLNFMSKNTVWTVALTTFNVFPAMDILTNDVGEERMKLKALTILGLIVFVR